MGPVFFEKSFKIFNNKLSLSVVLRQDIMISSAFVYTGTVCVCVCVCVSLCEHDHVSTISCGTKGYTIKVSVITVGILRW